MTSVRIRALTVRYGKSAVLDGVDLEVADGEFFFLLGPSGCGKTTLLRTIAGFVEPAGGDVLFAGRSMAGVPPERRDCGMVFQNYALWPHLTVAQNVAFGLDVRRIARDEKARRVREALRLVRMEEFAERAPASLSGGQQQRVALARALAVEPAVLLLDESGDGALRRLARARRLRRGRGARLGQGARRRRSRPPGAAAGAPAPRGRRGRRQRRRPPFGQSGAPDFSWRGGAARRAAAGRGGRARALSRRRAVLQRGRGGDGAGRGRPGVSRVTA
ncbi:MAG: ABC transporter ATP-binding protein [Planctomycetes bacterium]|nr:ABC transporter ATP-binding protein [Planctomycetota bacterium]